MDWTILLFAVQITLARIADIYLRYYAFREMVTPEAKRVLLKRLSVFSIFFTAFSAALFTCTEMTVSSYKAVLLFGWIPYQYFLVRAVPNQKLPHVFLVSMSFLWNFIIHSISCIILALYFRDASTPVVLQTESFIYLSLFLLFLPISRYFFNSLLPAFAHFNSKNVRIYIAVLPFLMTVGYIVLISDNVLWHPWEERIARLLLPAAFVFTYHYIISTAKQVYERKRLTHEKVLLKQELLYLEEGRLLAADNREQLQKHLDGLLDTYSQLRQLLHTGDIKEAQAYIAQQEEKLSAAAILPYTDYAIVNAAISIYLHRAKAKGINIIQKINLPKGMNADENDLSVLVANLLENALLASANGQEPRQITLILQHNGSQCVLELANTFHGELQLGEDGLPKSGHSGHGIGMLSLKNFLTKYNGYADFSCENGWVRITIYWEDKAQC